MEPRVSVVLPVRNGAEFIEAAVASVLGQSFGAFELLVVDDGSTDGTGAILARLAAGDARVVVLPGAAEGIVPALNRGLAVARGGYVARMDADDLAHPDRFARQVAVLDGAPGVVLVGSAYRVFGAGRATRLIEAPTEAAAIRAALAVRNPIAHPTVMFRREAVVAVGGYRAAFRLAEDFDLWLRLSERADLVNLAEPLLEYRAHAGQSAWLSVEQRAFSEMAALAAAARRRAGLTDGVEGSAPADRVLLRRLGMEEEAITAGVIGRAVGSAKDALDAGQGVAARGFIAVALRQRGLHPRTRVHLWLLRVRALLLRHGPGSRLRR